MYSQKKKKLSTNHYQLSNEATQLNPECFAKLTLEGSITAKLVRPLLLTFQLSMDIKPSFLVIAISQKH